MKIRLLLAVAGLAIGFAVPVLAQEKETIDPELRQQIEALFMKLDEAFNKNDLAATVAQYTQDAVLVNRRVSEGGASVGHSAIEKYFTLEYSSTPYGLVNKLVHVHTIGNEMCAITEWSATHTSGQAVWVLVRDADTWKIRMLYFN
jgi:uncharacterized protein (TIGR02246 family)